jgi:nicotinamide-nucleotide amidase
MRAYILSIGRELILGHITDTNATFLSQELTILGIELLHVVQVSDDRARITQVIQNALADADLIICTGGIGPTADDLTREAIADVVGETPEVDPGLLATIERFFASRGQQMPDQNKKQAWTIPSAQFLPNPVGTAPGWFVELDGKVIACMPGVPREMTRMWTEQVVPRIRTRLPQRIVSMVRLRTIGIGESAVEKTLTDLVALENPVVATYAKDDGVHVLIAAVAANQQDADTMQDDAATEVEKRLNQFIYAKDDTSLADALVQLVQERKRKLGIVDSGGGGRFASLILSSQRSDSILARTESVSPGTRTAAQLAESAHKFGASLGLGIAVTYSVAENGLFDADVVVAINGDTTVEERFPSKARFEEVQRRSGMIAADVLHRYLKAQR